MDALPADYPRLADLDDVALFILYRLGYRPFLIGTPDKPTTGETLCPTT